MDRYLIISLFLVIFLAGSAITLSLSLQNTSEYTPFTEPTLLDDSLDTTLLSQSDLGTSTTMIAEPLSPTSTTKIVMLEQDTLGNPFIEKKGTSMIIQGEALGTMFFEAGFPVRFENEFGEILAEGLAQATSEWMTTSSVPFVATLSLLRPAENVPGVFIFLNDNPSGLEEYSIEVRIPARIP